MEKKDIQKVRRAVFSYYRTHGRHDLPWRQTEDPYRILVSEIMLQQTQVNRVIPKYTVFIRRFPTVRVLAKASLRDVLVLWHGLGYNRRARALHEAAKYVVEHYKGKVPSTYEDLLKLPGVGPYTAGAVCVFSANASVPLLETNVRTVLFHHVLQGGRKATDKELMDLAEQCMDRKRSREWHWALMDYGSYLKGKGVRTNMRSAHYVRQSKFKGSDREVRGAIVRFLTSTHRATENDIVRCTGYERARVRGQLKKLKEEKLLRSEGASWFL